MSYVCDFANSVISEIISRFPMILLLNSMQILNPNEWPNDKKYYKIMEN